MAAGVLVTESSDVMADSSYRTASPLDANFEREPLLRPRLNERTPSSDIIRPCYYILQLLGMWKPRNTRYGFVWEMYSAFVRLLWLGALVGIMSLDFVHYGFKVNKIHGVEILNSVPTCLNLLCPFVFTVNYFQRGRFEELVAHVQNISPVYHERVRKLARIYTAISVTLWILGSTFFIFHWIPFFRDRWNYVAYITIIVYTTGWWAVWLSIYGYVCQVHTLQIDEVVQCIRTRENKPGMVLFKHQQLQNMLEKTQSDFNVIISFALVYHSVDIIIFSFAYFDVAFGNRYKLWQYVGAVLFDLISIVIKLFPPALVSAYGRHIVTQASKRCGAQVTPQCTQLPMEELRLFQYIACCEEDMGLKILGICITVELAGTIMMTIATAAVSFVAFVVPDLK